MTLWNQEYSEEKDQGMIINHWKFLMNRLDVALRIRMLVNCFMMLMHFFIVYIIVYASRSFAVDMSGYSYLLTILFGVTMCVVWRVIGFYYRYLVSSRVSVIHEIEKAMPIMAFTHELDGMHDVHASSLYAIGFVESIVPIIIVLFYTFLLVVGIVKTNIISFL